MVYDIVPVPKPRQTRSDKWKKRPVVLRYRAFADECRAKGVNLKESGQHITFGIPMAESWSKKKKADHLGMPHQQRPDVDNLAKALMDAVLKEDCAVWEIKITKVWASTGYIMIRDIYE